MENTDLTHELSKNICEMIRDGNTAEEIRKAYNIQSNTFRHWIEDAMLRSVKNMKSPLRNIRDTIIERVMKDTVILGMLKAATTSSEKVTRKHVILSELSKADRELLERDGLDAFIEKTKGKEILKVEETVETNPPQTSLFKEILKAIDNGEVEASQKLMDFSPSHPDLPPV